MTARVGVADRSVVEAGIPSPGQLHELIVEWNATGAVYPQNRCLHELVRAQSERTPREVAVSSGTEHISYADLEDQASRLANYLRRRGVGPEKLVAICMERSIDMAVALLAVLEAGGAYLPLDPEQPVARAAEMIDETQPVLIVTSARLRAWLPRHPVPLVVVDRERSAWLDCSPIAGPTSGPTNLAYVLYTSGSTGKPKGVMIEHRSLVNHLTWRAGAFHLGPRDRVLQKAPLGFDVSAWEMFCPLISGATVVMLAPGAQRDPRQLSATIRRENISVISFGPSMLQVLADEGALQGLPSLRIVAIGGEVLKPALAQTLCETFGDSVSILNLYGPTEATIISTWWRCRPGDEAAPIGRPIANTQIYILDENLYPTPIGVVGELYIGGVGVARGYFKRADLTAARFLANPFRSGERMYRSGDLARYRPDGALEYVGRTDDQVKVRGYRVELGEVEVALSEHPAVRQAVVVSRDDGHGDVALVAYIVPRRVGSAPDPAALRRLLRTSLPKYMVPAAFVVVDSIPLASNGKVDRKALPDPGYPAYRGRDYVPPRSALERRLAEIFGHVLGLKRVGSDDDFFELGGHSLKAVRLLSEVEMAFGVSVPLASIFEGNTTVSAMASVVEAALQPGRSEGIDGVASHARGLAPVLFFVHPDEAALLSLRHLFGAIGPAQRVVGLLPERPGRRFDPSRGIEELAMPMVAAIRDTQPHGPYVVGGFSLGGLLAYEVAGRLHAAGEEVAWLGIVDSPVGQARYQGALWPRTPRGFLRRLRQLGTLGAARSGKHLVWRWLRVPLTRLSWASPLALGYDFDYRGAARLGGNYAPPGHTVAMDLFTSADSVDESGSPALGWESVHQGSIVVHASPGSHFSLVTEAGWRVLAENVRACLETLPSTNRSRAV